MANIDLTTYRKDELAERDWMDPDAEFYLASEVDTLIADKDREIARLKDRKSPDIGDAVALGVYSGKSLPNELVYRKAAVDALLLKRGIIERPIPGPAVAELKDPYFTTCVICNKPWGAGELHAMHSVTFHGRLVTDLFVCCDCNAKIRRGEI